MIFYCIGKIDFFVDSLRVSKRKQQKRTFFENFYYLTLNVSSAIKNGLNTNDQNNFIYCCLQNPTFIQVNKFCPNCNDTTLQNEKKEIFTKPLDIIIYIKQDDQNNISNISYPISFNMPVNQSLQTGNNFNMEIYNLKAVIQRQISSRTPSK